MTYANEHSQLKYETTIVQKRLKVRFTGPLKGVKRLV